MCQYYLLIKIHICVLMCIFSWGPLNRLLLSSLISKRVMSQSGTALDMSQPSHAKPPWDASLSYPPVTEIECTTSSQDGGLLKKVVDTVSAGSGNWFSDDANMLKSAAAGRTARSVAAIVPVVKCMLRICVSDTCYLVSIVEGVEDKVDVRTERK